MNNLDKDTVISNFSIAYARDNGFVPIIEEKSGWYSVDGGSNIRLAQLVEMTLVANQSALSKGSETNNESQQTPATIKRKVEKPFCVQDFYSQQILQKTADIKASR